MISTVDAENTTQGTSLNKNQSPSDVPDEQNSQEPKQNKSRDITFNMLLMETIFFIALAVTTFGALHSLPAKVSKVPQAVRFFNRDSIVKDWYKGELVDALSSINSQDVSFVMYYAPWDAESQYVKGEFEKAANIMSDRVHFSAINCWNPGSECRLQHSKIPSWPVLIAYTVTSRGILYKGPKNAENMINFLELIIKPLERVSTTEDIVNLLSICDAVAVGFTPLADTSRYYNTWYSVALKSKEYDTVGEICFAVVTSPDLALNLGVDSTPRARLMLWNDTKEYKLDENQEWNETMLMSWTLENFLQPVARIIPLWKKSFSFVRYADGNPILILFTPLNPLYEQLPSYALLREVAMEYYNCKSNSSFQWTAELAKLQQVQRLLYQQRDIFKQCRNKYEKPLRAETYASKKQFVTQHNKYPWNNVTQKDKKSGMFNYVLKHGLAISKLIENSNEKSALWSTLGFLEECGTYDRALPAQKNIYEKHEKCQTFEEQFHHDSDLNMEEREIETTMLPSENDPRSADNLYHEYVRHRCRLMQYAHEVAPAAFPAKVSSGNITHIAGLSCGANTSLHFLAIDSTRNYHFAEALGVDIKNKQHMTAAIILDTKQENQYVLSAEYSAKSIREFIYNFTKNNLKRTLRTHVENAQHTHFFDSSRAVGVAGENKTYIHELTTRTFRKFIRTPGMLKLVGVCGGACAAHVSRALASAVRLLRACGVNVRAARLDAVRHDLPWAYAAHRFPVLLVFSADGDEGDSWVYPWDARISVSGLTALTLRTLGAPRDVRVRLALCSLPYEHHEKKKCLKDLRHHIATLISRSLKNWRRTDVRELKDSLYRRLVHLHQVSLYLSVLHPDDLRENNVTQDALINALNALSENWHGNETAAAVENQHITR